MANTLNKMSLHPDTKQLVLTLILGFIGAVVNLFPIDLAFKISLVLGNTAYIVAASFLRPHFALLCGLISTIPLYFYWGHPFGFITFGLEAWFISTLRARGWFIATADILYWLVIGMPLTALLIWFNSESAQTNIILTTFKQALNATLYASLGSILLLTFNDYFRKIKTSQPRLVKSLPQWFLYCFWSISAFFVIVLSFLLSTGFSESQRTQFDNKLAINNNYITDLGNNYLNEHKLVIQNLAHQLSRITDPAEQQLAISKTHHLYPGFISMIVASAQGEIELASPNFIIEQLGSDELSVADRPYFINAMEQQKLFVSSVFLGRGFGADPIVAISAPIFLGKEVNKPSGIVEGSLNVGQFGLYNAKGHDKNEVKIIVTDQNNKIIYASNGLGLKTLSELKYKLHPSKSVSNLISLKAGSNIDKGFIYKQGQLMNNWTVYSLVEHDLILNTIENIYLIIFITLFFILLFVSIFAKKLALHLNRPLKFVLNELSNVKKTCALRDIPYETPTEIQELYQELKLKGQALIAMQEELQAQVFKRTEELNQANNKLTEQANTDSLTGLYNRRYFNHNFKVMQAILSRSHAKMMFAIIDLDLFKNINDTHGHFFGDYCLIEIADILKKFFNRETDIVARFGGEEFVIISSSDDVKILRARFEKLRLQIANYSFKYNLKDSIQLTISIGIAFGNANYSREQEDWLIIADECLYLAKNNGRNQTEIKVLDGTKFQP